MPGVGKAGLGYSVSSQLTTASMRSMSAYGDVVLLAERGGHVDMGDVVAGGRIDPVERLEKDPVAAEVRG